MRADGTVGFHLDGAYDPTRALILDPTLALGSYWGGSSTDNGNALFVDAAGSLYIAGTTSSSNFPTANPYQDSLHGSADAFVTKISPSGTLIYSTYLGGVMMGTGDSGPKVSRSMPWPRTSTTAAEPRKRGVSAMLARLG